MSRLIILIVEPLKYFAILFIFWMAAVSIDNAPFGSVICLLAINYILIASLTSTSNLDSTMMTKDMRKYTFGSSLMFVIPFTIFLSAVCYFLLNKFRVVMSSLEIDPFVNTIVLILLPLAVYRTFCAMLNTIATSWVARIFSLITVGIIAALCYRLFIVEQLGKQGLVSVLVIGVSFGTLLLFLSMLLFSGWNFRIDFTIIPKLLNRHLQKSELRSAFYLMDFLGFIIAGIMLGMQNASIAALSLILVIPVRYLPLLLINSKLVDKAPAKVFSDFQKGLGIVRFSLIVSILLALLIAVSSYITIHKLLPDSYLRANINLLIMLPGAILLGLSSLFIRILPNQFGHVYLGVILWLGVTIQFLGLLLLLPSIGFIGIALAYSISALVVGISIIYRGSQLLKFSVPQLFNFHRDDLIDFIY